MSLSSVEAQIQDALYARLATFAPSPPIPIAFDGVASARSTGVPYLAVSFHVTPTRRIFVDSDAPQTHSGFLQVSLMTPANDHRPVAARELCASIADLFPTDQKIHRDGVGPGPQPSERPTISEGFVDGAWWNTPVTINWSCYA